MNVPCMCVTKMRATRPIASLQSGCIIWCCVPSPASNTQLRAWSARQRLLLQMTGPPVGMGGRGLGGLGSQLGVELDDKGRDIASGRGSSRSRAEEGDADDVGWHASFACSERCV